MLEEINRSEVKFSCLVGQQGKPVDLQKQLILDQMILMHKGLLQLAYRSKNGGGFVKCPVS
jgi:hypothetical protein